MGGEPGTNLVAGFRSLGIPLPPAGFARSSRAAA